MNGGEERSTASERRLEVRKKRAPYRAASHPIKPF